MKKIGVNGFGRIGRYSTRVALMRDDVEVALVNDITSAETLAHLFKYDSVHRQLPLEFRVDGNDLVFENGKRISIVSHHDPADIPWSDYGVEYVLESTGIFRTEASASAHLKGGAKKVVISAPAKGGNVKTIVLGLNDELLDPSDVVLSNASCTTNSAAPLLSVMCEMCTIENVFLTTIHSYTSDQRLHDAPHMDLRRARAAAESIIPTTTGAADALVKIFPHLKGKIGGSAVRVPVANGSLTDVTLIVDKAPGEDAIKQAMLEASQGRLKSILGYTNDPIVSVDIIGNSHSSIFDASLTRVQGNMIKIVGWYDNEAGYSNRLVDLIMKL